jgi:type VI secretion system FHA domain protein
MTLNLTVISYAGRKPASPLAVSFGDRGGIIGREPSCDWVLEDPNGHVSKRHGRIEYVSGQYRIKDTSTNGIFLGNGGKRLGFGVSAVLKDGDLLHIGGYDIVVQLSAVEEGPRRPARSGVAADGVESFDEAAAVLSRLANMVGQPAVPASAAEQAAAKSPRPEAVRAWGSPSASPAAAKRAPASVPPPGSAATPAARTQAAAPIAQEARERAAAQEALARAAVQEARARAAAQEAREARERAAAQEARAQEARAQAAAQEAREARERAAAQEARDRAAAQEARARAAEHEARARAAAQEARARAAAQEARARAAEQEAREARERVAAADRAAAQEAQARAAAQEARARAAAQEARDRAAAQEAQARAAAQEARARAAAQDARDRAAAQEAQARAAAQEARDRAALQAARDQAAAQAVRDQAVAAAARRQALALASRSAAPAPIASLVAAPGDDLDTGGRGAPQPMVRPQQDRNTRYDTGTWSAVIEEAGTEGAEDQLSASPKSLAGRDADSVGWARWQSGDASAEMFDVPADDGTLTLTRVAEAVPVQPATLLEQVPLPLFAPDALEPFDLAGYEEEAVAARAAKALTVVPQRKRATFAGWALAFSLCAAFVISADLWVDRPVAIYLHRHFIAPGVIETFENCVLGLMPLGAVMMLICGALALSGKSLPRWAEAGTLSAFSLFWALPSTFFLLKPAFGRYDTTQFFSEPSLYGFAPFHGTVQSGFPSEHATIVAAVFSVFWIFFPRFRPLSSAAIGLVIGGLILLSWHFVSDVVAGLFVGTTSGVMTVRLWRNAQSGAVTGPANPSSIRLAQN